MRIDRAYLYAFSFVAIILVTIAISFACSLPIAPSYGKAGFSLSFPRERAASFVAVRIFPRISRPPAPLPPSMNSPLVNGPSASMD